MIMMLRLAARNLLRNRRRTQLTMMAMIAAVTCLILVQAINDGFLWAMIDNATETMLGHVNVTDPEYVTAPALNRTLPEDPALRQALMADARVKGVCARVSCFVLLSCGHEDAGLTQPAEVLGIDPAEERGLSRLGRTIVAGRFLADAEAREIVLGAGLARRLGAQVGAEIIVMGQAADGSLANEVLTLVGIVETGDTARDATLALLGRRLVQTLLVLERRIHRWIVFLHSPVEARPVADAQQKLAPSTVCQPWQKMLPQIAAVLDIVDAMKYVLVGIFYFAVFLVTLNTVNMAFLERMKEFAILGAVGLTKRRLATLILAEGALMSGMSAVIGAGLGSAVSAWIRRHPIDLSGLMGPIAYGGAAIQPVVTAQNNLAIVTNAALIMVLLGVVVSLFPAYRLYRVRPAAALRES